MWRCLVIVIGLSLWLSLSGPALAQSVAVRSGEHDSFSRLTLNLRSRPDWELKRTEAGVDLILTGDTPALDVSQIFTRIPRGRITEADWDSAERTLKLSLSCECAAEAFWHDDTLLVLDISDGPPKALTEAMMDRPDQSRIAAEGEASVAFQPMPDLVRFETLPRRSDLGFSFTRPEAERSAATAPTDREPQVPDELREVLLTQISRAASQGLLDARSPGVTAGHTGQDIRPTGQDAPADATRADDHSVTDHVQLRAESSIDHDFMDRFPGIAQDIAQTGCLPEDRIDVGSWGSDEPFGQQLSDLHLRLTGEFDRLDEDVAGQLVRRYLYFGFGAEAAMALQMLPEDSEDRSLLTQLAEVVEYGHAKSSHTYLTELDCASPAALWAALSYAELPSGRAIDHDAILRAFNALPEHLRSYFGPILSQRFLRHGDTDMAAKLLRILDRNMLTGSPQADLAKAELSMANGADDAADAALADLAESNAEPSVTALVQMIDRRFSTGREISFELAQLAGSYAYERQDELIGPDLSAAYIRALVAAGAVDQGFAELDRAHPGLTDAQRTELISDILGKAAETADDMTFLRHAIPAADSMAHLASVVSGNRMGKRLMDLGFPEEAEAFLVRTAPPNHPEADTRLLLRARQALAVNKPRKAIVELLGLEGETANLLRAEARVMVGEHKAAYHLYTAAEEPELARQQAWLAEAWRDAESEENPVYSELADTMEAAAEEATASSVSETVLARNRGLVEVSVDVRQTMQALLADNPLPATPGK